ncbi:unnamed protein product [Euphydryas editha]|uniref:Uncharacterized protein n=1 Tax=Euphydryas editha TaxID=104508 RepID=A0AAU9TW82_EUPED|nr:unnamed protein product [Euphydryas editha]
MSLSTRLDLPDPSPSQLNNCCKRRNTVWSKDPSFSKATSITGDPEHERQPSLRKATSSSLPQAFEQRVIQPASIHKYPDHKHVADAHSWSSPTAFAATLAQHTALRPVSKQRRTSLLVDAAAVFPT